MKQTVSIFAPDINVASKSSAIQLWLNRKNQFFSSVLEEDVSNRQVLLLGHALLCFLCINMRIFRITGSRSDLSGLVHGGIAALCERRPGMKFIIEPSAASGMIRLPLKKEMKVPSLWEIMVSKYFSVKIYKY